MQCSITWVDKIHGMPKQFEKDSVKEQGFELKGELKKMDHKSI